jgi:hypothetical protein
MMLILAIALTVVQALLMLVKEHELSLVVGIAAIFSWCML